MISLKDIEKSFGTKEVLKKANLTIYDGERVGIVGNNGEGKSTLLGILTKEISADAGEVVSNDTIGVLKQSSEIDLQNILDDISNSTEGKSFLTELKKLGVTQNLELTKTRLNSLSPGERTKVALAYVFSKSPQTLILDEPTNHLDMEAKQLIINYINDFYGTVIIVSHDKDFLNQTVNKIVELKSGELKEYYGNYDDYVEQKQNEQLNIKRTYEKHKKDIENINKQIDMYQRALEKSDKKCASGAKRRTCNTTTQDERAKSLSKFAASRVSKLKQHLNEDVERPEKEVHIRYRLQKEDIKTKFVVIAENLKKSFAHSSLFENANFTIEAGDKIALIGRNGTGKSTLINMILGKTDYEGTLRVTKSLKIATMFQDVYDLDEEKTINEMSKQNDKEFRTAFITNLCSMNIDKSRFDTKIKFLSSGEKMRIKLCEIILSDCNMIILDEPTNHLDILNKDYLQKVLSGFCGTILIVSHDKEFLKATTNKVLKIENKTIKFCESI